MELISRPKLLFADEPTSGLDPALERALMENFKTLTGDGRVVIVTTHIMSSLDLLDVVCVLSAGRRVFFGPPARLKEFFEVDDFVEIYSKLQARPAREWEEAFRRSSIGEGVG